ncbi:hypothetical protein GF337_16820, partial [candidate division KSB1 bacterium]|nr:hypothetical protein [candidate division KSB1 bacterium]
KGIDNPISIGQIRESVKSDTNGLRLDLRHITRLTDDRVINPENIYGIVHVGPYPFEAAEEPFAYKRFRNSEWIIKGTAVIPVHELFPSQNNSEDWVDFGKVCIRMELYLERRKRDFNLGVYDTFAWVEKHGNEYIKVPSIVEGPLVHLLNSDDPEKIVVSLKTDEAVKPVIMLSDSISISADDASQSHEIGISGLMPDTEYRYWVEIGKHRTKTFHFKTAPKKIHTQVKFAYCGDSREGISSNMSRFMGTNYETMHRLAALAYHEGAEFFVFGGDLISGYTTSPVDFRTQLHAWKQAMSGFWNERPVYAIMGNHEALLRRFSSEVGVDRFPYETESAEVIFADELINPENGPVPDDPRRPPYRETCFSFQYGDIFFIGINNNYWYSNRPYLYGGCPEGYILPDQMDWIRENMEQANSDPTVRYIIIFSQEPLFPCGGHIMDTMWYSGNNNVRAYIFEDDSLKSAEPGIIDLRNELTRLFAASPKVAAVLGSDEHSYYRLQINNEVPVGDPVTDDLNNNNWIDWEEMEVASPLADLQYPVWYITCGGGGAPYYAEGSTPWVEYWKANQSEKEAYYYSSQENIIIFSSDDNGINMDVYNPYGNKIDSISNLMEIKKR